MPTSSITSRSSTTAPSPHPCERHQFRGVPTRRRVRLGFVYCSGDSPVDDKQPRASQMRCGRNFPKFGDEPRSARFGLASIMAIPFEPGRASASDLRLTAFAYNTDSALLDARIRQFITVRGSAQSLGRRLRNRLQPIARIMVARRG